MIQGDGDAADEEEEEEEEQVEAVHYNHRVQVDLDPFVGDVAAALLVADAVDSEVQEGLVLAVTCFACK